MANIQSAFNQMLSSGVAASYLASHTPAYQKHFEKKELLAEEKALEKESDALMPYIEDPKSDTAELSAAEYSDELLEREAKNAQRLYQLTGKDKYLKKAIQTGAEASKLVPEVKQAQTYTKEARRKQAEKRAADEYEAKVLSLQNEKQQMAIRKSILEGTVPTDRYNELMKTKEEK